MKLSELQAKERQVEVVFQDEPVKITYRANAVTPAFLADNPDAVEQVKRTVVRWDIVDDDGKELAPGEIADKMPVQFLSTVLTAIVDDMRIGEAEKKR